MLLNPQQFIFPWIFLFFHTVANGSEVFFVEYNAKAKAAYQAIFALRFKEAHKHIAQLKADDPYNLVVHHLENYIDFFLSYIEDDHGLYDSLKEERNKRLEALKQVEITSPYALYVRADIRLQWALLRAKYGEYLSALTEVNRAHKLLKKNQERFPGFIANQKSLGIIHTIVGAIPDTYQWGIELLTSLEGAVDEGMSELKNILDSYSRDEYIHRQETVIVYGLLLLHVSGEKTKAWEFLWKQLSTTAGDNALDYFILFDLALKCGKNEKAMTLFANRPQGAGRYRLTMLEYMHGLAKLRQLDSGGAISHFQSFVRNYRGRSMLGKIYEKLAWASLLDGNRMN